MIASVVTFIIGQLILEIGSRPYLGKLLDLEKFPIGSEVREFKVKFLGERLYRLILFFVFSTGLYLILRESDFLDVNLGGDKVNPEYFDRYPC